MTHTLQDEIQDSIQALKKKLDKDTFACPVCNCKNIKVVNGIFVNRVVVDGDKEKPVNQNLPALALVCVNCGFISQHVLGDIVTGTPEAGNG